MPFLLESLTKRDIRAVIFDLDDTLYPEIQYVKSGFKAVSVQIKKDFGIDCYELMLSLFGEDKSDVYGRTLSRCGIVCNDAYMRKLISVYRTHIPQGLEFFSDVRPFLAELKNRGIATGIITDGRIEGQKRKLAALGCYGLFDKIIITDELGGEKFRKPSAAAFEIICRDLKAEIRNAAYIGDNPTKDFYIGSKGAFTVRIKRSGALNFGEENYYLGVKENLLIECLI